MTKGRVASLFFIGVGLYVLIQSIRLPVGSFSNPGAGFFPLLLSLLLTIVGVLLLATDRGGEPMHWGGVIHLWRSTPWQLVGLTAAYVLVFDWLGFLISSFSYLLLILYVCCRFRAGTAVGLAAALTLGSWGLFVKLLALQFPRGLWGP